MEGYLELAHLSEKVLELLEEIYQDGDVTRTEYLEHISTKINFLEKIGELV